MQHINVIIYTNQEHYLGSEVNDLYYRGVGCIPQVQLFKDRMLNKLNSTVKVRVEGTDMLLHPFQAVGPSSTVLNRPQPSTTVPTSCIKEKILLNFMSLKMGTNLKTGVLGSWPILRVKDDSKNQNQHFIKHHNFTRTTIPNFRIFS